MFLTIIAIAVIALFIGIMATLPQAINQWGFNWPVMLLGTLATSLPLFIIIACAYYLLSTLI